MPLQHAYAVTNKAAALAATAFTWSTGTTTNRAYLNDGRMDKRMVLPSSAGPISCVIDFGADVELSAIAVLNHNMASATSPTLKVRAADNSAITTNVVTAKNTSSLTTTAPRHKDHVLQFDATTKRYWEINFSWTGSFALSLGEIFPCVTTALTRFTLLGHGEAAEYMTTEFRARSGERRGHFLAGPYREKKIRFEDLSESERDELLTLHRATYGGALPLLWCQQYETGDVAAPAAYQDVILGKLVGMDRFAWQESDYLRHEVDELTIGSLAREVGA